MDRPRGEQDMDPSVQAEQLGDVVVASGPGSSGAAQDLLG